MRSSTEEKWPQCCLCLPVSLAEVLHEVLSMTKTAKSLVIFLSVSLCVLWLDCTMTCLVLIPFQLPGWWAKSTMKLIFGNQGAGEMSISELANQSWECLSLWLLVDSWFVRKILLFWISKWSICGSKVPVPQSRDRGIFPGAPLFKFFGVKILEGREAVWHSQVLRVEGNLCKSRTSRQSLKHGLHLVCHLTKNPFCGFVNVNLLFT